MTADPDLLVPFDADLVELVAGRHDVTAEDLRELLASHQRQVRANPGVDDIVYEWRTQFHEQPLVTRTDDVYYLLVRDHVWDEFADALDVAEATMVAVNDVHEEQTRRDTGAERGPDERFMILARD